MYTAAPRLVFLLTCPVPRLFFDNELIDQSLPFFFPVFFWQTGDLEGLKRVAEESAPKSAESS